MEGNFHVCTDGTSSSLIYRDKYDYIRGMNDIPVCLSMTNLSLLCFCLMSNHVHFVFRGSSEDCSKFIVEFKRRTSQRLRSRYSQVASLHRQNITIKKMESDEQLLTAIAYVLRNPVDANLNRTPNNYRWSSANLYFSGPIDLEKYRRVKDFGTRAARETFSTRVKLPEEYLVDSYGMIYPGSYVNVREVEKRFKSVRELLFRFSKNDDRKFEIDTEMVSRGSYNDEKVDGLIISICKEDFNTDSFIKLDLEDKYMLASLLWRRYRIKAKQLARITGLDQRALEEVMK